MEALLSLSSRPSCLIGCRGTCFPAVGYFDHEGHTFCTASTSLGFFIRHGWVSVLETLLGQCVVIMWLHKEAPFFYNCHLGEVPIDYHMPTDFPW